ncbi:MAG: hypothetical protein HKN50_08140 [Gammaproteobacteria bacterium]|nr:hypothetical protein [Gammaproteobacteria bacterium]
MKILARKEDDFVLCLLPDGQAIEITMVKADGEDFYPRPNIDEAIRLLLQHLPTLLEED